MMKKKLKLAVLLRRGSNMKKILMKMRLMKKRMTKHSMTKKRMMKQSTYDLFVSGFMNFSYSEIVQIDCRGRMEWDWRRRRRLQEYMPEPRIFRAMMRKKSDRSLIHSWFSSSPMCHWLKDKNFSVFINLATSSDFWMMMVKSSDPVMV
ncbi:hypothetical protein CMV_020174 [Castanea mollissima]|uniref:Uncharacterized protein n=1 Tax=Castanea mollissima TaxID=60419 RepID=A0A8J4QZ21_9ROSI|nr:hypothetical protein CMV_020174 [Castanea mollissima]